MPDISYQQRLLAAMQDPNSESSPMGALRALGGSIGNAWQGYQGRTDEQDATKFFIDNPATPETIQQFGAAHPQMPMVDVYRIAGLIKTQKKAQQAKDMFKALDSAVANGVELDEKKLAEIHAQYPDVPQTDVMQLMELKQKVGHGFDEAKKLRDENTRQVGLSKELDKMTSPYQVVEGVESQPVTDPNATMGGETSYPALKMKTVTPKVTAAELYRAVIPYLDAKDAATLVGKMAETERKDQGLTIKDVFEHGYKYTPESLKVFSKSFDVGDLVPIEKVTTPQIRSVDRGDVVDIYENGVKVRTEKKGMTPNQAAKPEEGPTSADLKRLGEMITAATNSGKEDPSANDKALITKAANMAGYDFVNTKGSTPGVLWGTNPTSTWDLVPKVATTISKTGGNGKKQIGTKGGKPVYDLGNGQWQVGD
jgi:hypothetical protein